MDGDWEIVEPEKTHASRSDERIVVEPEKSQDSRSDEWEIVEPEKTQTPRSDERVVVEPVEVVSKTPVGPVKTIEEENGFVLLSHEKVQFCFTIQNIILVLLNILVLSYIIKNIWVILYWFSSILVSIFLVVFSISREIVQPSSFPSENDTSECVKIITAHAKQAVRDLLYHYWRIIANRRNQ